MVTTETCADLATCPLGDRTVQLRARALQRCESASLHWVDWGAEGSALNDHFPLQAAGFGQALWSLWPCSFTCSVQSLSRVQLFATPWTAARQASLSITNSRSLPTESFTCEKGVITYLPPLKSSSARRLISV